MYRLTPALCVAAAAILCMAAAKSALDVAFHNTIVSTYPDGRTAKLWLEPDGTYVAQGRKADRSSGHWTQKGEQLCLKQSKPFPAPFNYCTAMVKGGVGTTWSGKAVSGEAIRIKLVKGRNVPKG